MAADDRNKPPSPEQEERDRRAANVFLLVGALIFIGIGVWITGAMMEARRADECMSSGRRNCSPIEVPAR